MCVRSAGSEGRRSGCTVLKKWFFSHRLFHNQVYDFQLYRAKLDLLSKELSEEKYKLLRAYLEKIPTESFPHHIFQPNHSDNPSEKGLSRSSQMKLQTFDFVRLKKQNLANSLASLGLLLAKTNKERHESIQGFMIANDSVTIACEVPVYLTSDDIKYFKSKSFMINFQDYKTLITGHIDLLQIRSGLIHILDYKPGADKANAVNQLVVSALALASGTKLNTKILYTLSYLNEAIKGCCDMHKKEFSIPAIPIVALLVGAVVGLILNIILIKRKGGLNSSQA